MIIVLEADKADIFSQNKLMRVFREGFVAIKRFSMARSPKPVQNIIRSGHHFLPDVE